MRFTRNWLFFTIAGLIILWPGAVMAGGGGGGGGPCAGFASGTTLVMEDNCFSGVAHFARAGNTLLVRNDGDLPHSFTAVDGSFDTGLLQPGQTARIPLEADGISRAYCTLHGTADGHGMTGVLVVGNPEPKALGAAGLDEGSVDSLVEHDKALLGELETQSRSLAALRSELTGMQQALEKIELALPAHPGQGEAVRAPSGVNSVQAAALGIFGVALFGAGLAVVLTLRRPVEPAG